MNTTQTQTRLIKNMADLNETVVLELVKERMQAGENPFEIISYAQEAMNLVGERYEQGKYYISSMMMAGEIFREIMEIVEPILVSRMTTGESGNILLGTVQGDIHDIGKNIVGVLMRCHGFTVTDLGVDVPPGEFVKETVQMQPDIISLSGLLTVSYDAMKDTITEIRKLDSPNFGATPILVGGGTINAMVCGFVGADYWATDAMVGMHFCKQIMADRDH